MTVQKSCLLVYLAKKLFLFLFFSFSHFNFHPKLWIKSHCSFKRSLVDVLVETVQYTEVKTNGHRLWS